MNTLQYGDSGESVKIVQEKLQLLDLYSGTITGMYNDNTTVGVSEFQNINDLPVTGEVDIRTWNLLLSETEPVFLRQSRVIPKTIRIGDTGPEVKELQKQLSTLLYYNGNIDGTFDASTQTAVKSFQYINKLTSDGVVGANTWNALSYLYRPLVVCGGVPEPEPNPEPNPPTEPEVPNPSDEYYTVKAGDTLYSIASRFGLSVDELKSMNNLTSNNLSIGQTLKVKKESEVPQEEYDSYAVKAGDSLWGIASKYGTTVEELKRINNLSSNVLSIGQVLNVPKSGTTPEEPKEPEIPNPNEDTFDYIVIAGDSLWKIASKYDTTVEELRRLNNLTTDSLSIGQIIKVPNKENNNTPEETVHIVQKGDTLYQLAARYNTTVNAIKERNQLSNNNLSVGQVLVIPVAPTSEPYITHYVKSGDNLFSLARSYNTTVDKIKSLNNLTSNLLSIGQKLLIPKS